MCLQGVICFESLIEEGRKRGIVTDNKPIICKPNKVVCTCNLSSSVKHENCHAPLLRTEHSLHRAGAHSVQPCSTGDLPWNLASQ